MALVAEGHDWSYEDNVYSDDGDDADGDVDQEETFGSSSPHPMSPIAHRGHYSPNSYSSSLPSSFPSRYSSPSSSAASSDTPTSTSHLSSVHSTPPSFSTPPIPNTKTTPFLRLKRDPATNYHLNASIIGDANGHTPAGTTPGRSNRPRFHTPPLPSPARTTPFFVSKVRAKERVKTPQAKPLWTRAAEYPNGYDDESYGDPPPSLPIRCARRPSVTHSEHFSLQPTLAVVQTTTRIWSRNPRTRANALCFARRRSPPRRAPSLSSRPTPSRPGREASATARPLEGRWSPTTDA